MSNFLINRLSVIPMRCKPSHTAEIVSQILYGETVQLLNNQENWLFVSTIHDNYQGWVDAKQLKSVKKVPTEVFFVKNVTVLTSAGKNIPFGSRVEKDEVNASDITVQLPLSKDSLLHHSKKFIGTPYLWGGRTLYGIDCSGFVQILFLVHGLQLPRDAYLQAEVGESVDFEDRDAGHLAFFANEAGKVIHVGMLVDKNTIIHASGEVREDIFTKEGIYNEENKTLTHALHSIKKIF